MKISIENVKDIFKKAIKLLEGTEPKSSKECGFCEWKEKVK